MRTYAGVNFLGVSPRDAAAEMAVVGSLSPVASGTLVEVRLTSLAPDAHDYSAPPVLLSVYNGDGVLLVDSEEFDGVLDFMDTTVALSPSEVIDPSQPIVLVVHDDGVGARTLPPLVWEMDVEESDPAPAAFNDLSDVTLTSVASSDILVFNGSAWVNSAKPSYTSDPESSTYTGLAAAAPGSPFAAASDLNSLRTAYENLRALVETRLT